ncbi:LPS export ABC transporter periplasmic protein LptC [Candidatus Omnitrophota bacterium]
MLRRVIISTVLLILGLCGFSFAQELGGVAQEVEGFSLMQYKDAGEKRWKLLGKSAEVEGERIKISEISAVIFGKNTVFKLKAREGDFDKEQHLVCLEDDVIIKTTDGIKFTTDFLQWDTKTENMFTDAPVSIKRTDFEVNGRGATYNLEQEISELKKDVVANIGSLKRNALRHTGDAIEAANNKTQDVTITCDGPLEINYKKNQAIFKNNVKVENIQGNIFADRIDVYFKQDTKEVRCVAARGNVRIINGNNVTYSEKAIYLVDQGRLILPKRPKLVIQNEPPKQ